MTDVPRLLGLLAFSLALIGALMVAIGLGMLIAYVGI